MLSILRKYNYTAKYHHHVPTKNSIRSFIIMYTISGEPCESVPCPNNVNGSAMAATAACAGTSGGGGGGGSPPVPAAAAAAPAGHHSPYDLRRKSPPAYHEPGPSGACSLPARKRPRT